MKKTVFQFDDYKKYLTHMEDLANRVQRGFKSGLAKAIGCQNAFVSQVFNTGAHLSLEQGFLVAEHLKLNTEERRHFLLLIEYNRASTKGLKDFFRRERFHPSSVAPKIHTEI